MGINYNPKFILFCFFGLVIGTLPVIAVPSLVTTDENGIPQLDFSPGEIVYIHGWGFLIHAFIKIDVLRPDFSMESGLAYSDVDGSFTYAYPLDGIVGPYIVYATDGFNTATGNFTDAAIWTTKNDCGGSTQDVNHYTANNSVYINGDGFDPGVYFWEIKGKPGGASCDPDIAVANGTHSPNATGEFCFSAYTVQGNDCGEYQVKFGVKGDNYRVEGNGCNTSSNCGQKSSVLECKGLTVLNITTTPRCRQNNCNSTQEVINVTTCKGAGSTIVCIGNNVTNVTIIPSCSEGACANTSVFKTIEACDDGCSNGQCLEPFCGNNITDPGEACDDGNTNNFDQCRNDCTIPFCGDGTLDPTENCDDGNNIPDDGCSSFCQKEFCGDGIQQLNESCDDGNTNNFDDCRNNCALPFCGDTILDANETCDDGNHENNDGCNANCQTEFCGDGIIQTNESCDDENTNNFDTCRNNCSLPYCGDGILDVEEACDDGNTVNKDGCDSQCQIECEDQDKDGVCDPQDPCPDSKPGEPVDQDGCDPFQFCAKFNCGDSCEQADWMMNENTTFPNDCKTVIVFKEGVEHQPRCVPTEFTQGCAN